MKTENLAALAFAAGATVGMGSALLASMIFRGSHKLDDTDIAILAAQPVLRR